MPEPLPAADEVIVRARYTGLCGTDLHIVEGSHPRARLPLALGHEVVGIPEAGPFAGRLVLVDPLLSCGACTACRAGNTNACASLRLVGIDRNGALAGRFAVPSDQLHPVPETIPPSLAPVAEPLAVAVHAVRGTRSLVGRATVVVGAGPIGMLVAHVARRGGATVLLVEPEAQRRAMAARLGFELLHPTDPVGDLDARTEGRLADVVYDAAATAPVAAMVTRLVAPGGSIGIVGAYGPPAPVDLLAVMFKELTIVGHRAYRPIDVDSALGLLAADRGLIAPLVTSVIVPDQIPTTLLALRAGQEMKVVVEVSI